MHDDLPGVTVRSKQSVGQKETSIELRCYLFLWIVEGYCVTKVLKRCQILEWKKDLLLQVNI